MKKLLLIFATIASALSLLTAAPALAATDVLGGVCSGDQAAHASDANGTAPAVCADDSATSSSNPVYGKGGLLTDIINILSIVIGIIAIIVIMISGLRMIMANGDENGIATARNSLLFAVVGLVVAALAQTIIILVLNRL